MKRRSVAGIAEARAERAGLPRNASLCPTSRPIALRRPIVRKQRNAARLPRGALARDADYCPSSSWCHFHISISSPVAWRTT